MFADLLLFGSLPVILAGGVCGLFVDHRLHLRGFLLNAVGFFMASVSMALYHHLLVSVILAAVSARYFHDWWNSGGGDGMKRRFRSWADSLGQWLPHQA